MSNVVYPESAQILKDEEQIKEFIKVSKDVIVGPLEKTKNDIVAKISLNSNKTSSTLDESNASLQTSFEQLDMVVESKLFDLPYLLTKP